MVDSRHSAGSPRARSVAVPGCFPEAVWEELSHELGEGQRFFRVQFGTEEAMQRFLDELSENRYAKMALEKLSLSEVRTYTSPNSTLRVVVGWIS